MIEESQGITDSTVVREYFNETVPGFKEGYFHYRWNRSPLVREHYFQTLETLERTLANGRWGFLAEVGSGPCIWTPLLFEHASRGVTVDLSIEMLKQCSQQPYKSRCCCGDATQLPLKSDSVDALCSIRAFEYFPDKTQAIKEFFRILRPMGFLLVITKNQDYLGYGKNESCDEKQIHNGNVTADEMIELLQSEGFSGIQVRPVIIGRTRICMIWRLIRIVRRFVDFSGSRGFSRILASATESFMITAQKNF